MIYYAYIGQVPCPWRLKPIEFGVHEYGFESGGPGADVIEGRELFAWIIFP